MAVKRKTFSDGLTTYTQIAITPGRATPSDLKALREILPGKKPGQSDFDFAIEGAEAYWRSQPTSEGKPEPHSRSWYRAEILRRIEYVRKIVALKDAGDELNKSRLDSWIVDALTLGALIEEARWRLGFGEETRRGIKVRAVNRANARKGVESRVATRARENEKLRAAVEAQRRKHPNRSRQFIAKNLMSQFGGDGSDPIHALSQRIARIEREAG